MPLRLDETDIVILKALMEDGRKPLRQIAKMASVSTPTVESRVKKMHDVGLIRKIAPLLNTDKIEQGTTALLSLRIPPVKIDEVTSKLAELEEVRGLYLTTGESNLILKVALPNLEDLQEFIKDKLGALKGLDFLSSSLVTKILKEEPGATLKVGMGIRLKCDYCDGEIKGTPFPLKVGGHERYMCCKTCLTSYKQKYRV